MNAVRYEQQTKTKEVSYTVQVTQQEVETYTVTRQDPVAEKQLETYTVRIPVPVVKEVSFQVCRMVPKVVTVEINTLCDMFGLLPAGTVKFLRLWLQHTSRDSLLWRVNEVRRRRRELMPRPQSNDKTGENSAETVQNLKRADIVVVTRDSTLRAGEDAVGKVAKGEVLAIESVLDSWFYVNNGKASGWISRDDVLEYQGARSREGGC